MVINKEEAEDIRETVKSILKMRLKDINVNETSFMVSLRGSVSQQNIEEILKRTRASSFYFCEGRIYFIL